VSDDLKDYERRYTPGGKVAHLIWGPDWSRQEATYPHAACGWSGQTTYWRGTGNQDEYDRAAELPVCRRCLAAVER